MDSSGKAPSLLADRMLEVQESPTAAVSALVREKQREGHHVINLGEGELDFDTPQVVCDAGIQAIQNGDTRYTAVGGTPDLKAAIVEKFQREDGLDYGPDSVIASTGAKQIVFNAMLATVQAGDNVVIPTPSWVSYPEIVRIAGGTPKEISCPAEAGFKLQPEQLDAVIDSATKWLILNSPNNPTGAVLSVKELSALAEVLRQHPNVLVLADDIYQHVVYSGKTRTLAAVAPDLRDRVLTVNGVSKTHSMTGWRLGFAGGPAWLIKAIDTLQSQSTTNPSSVTQAAAACALREPLDFFWPRLAALKERRDRTLAALDEADGLQVSPVPDGAFYVFAHCGGLLGKTMPGGRRLETDGDVASYLVEEAGVATVPGTAFSMSPYLRIAYGVADEDLDLACRRIIEACARLD